MTTLLTQAPRIGEQASAWALPLRSLAGDTCPVAAKLAQAERAGINLAGCAILPNPASALPGLGDLTAQPGDGFTRSLAAETRYAPAAGFCVSLPGDVEVSAVTRSQLARWLAHATASRDLAWLGGWTDSDTGRAEINQTLLLTSRATALALGREWGQIAIFDLAAQCEISCETGEELDY